MFYCVLRTELSAVCLYGLYRELDTLLLLYTLATIYKGSAKVMSNKIVRMYQDSR